MSSIVDVAAVVGAGGNALNVAVVAVEYSVIVVIAFYGFRNSSLYLNFYSSYRLRLRMDGQTSGIQLVLSLKSF